MSDFYFDYRWHVTQGIGRFAREVRKRIVGMTDLPLGGSPSSPLDCVKTASTLFRKKASGYFSPGYNVPLYSSCPVICTIHDLIHIHYQQETSLAIRAYYQLVQRPVVRRSPLVLTVSEYSKSQICEWYDLTEDRVQCVGNGVSDAFTLEGERHACESEFFLYVGNCRPHKNLGILIQALSQITSSDDARLIMVTQPDDALRRTVDAYQMTDRVTFISDVTDEVLASYYRAAIATVLPSTFEGFGLSIVEAFACGCPVIGSRVTSIPEIVADAGLLFDPEDPAELAEKMAQILGDEVLRADLKHKGLARADVYRWDRVGQQVNHALAPYVNQS